MRAKEFLKESMTFGPAVEKTYKDDQGETKTYWTGDPWWSTETKPCWVCDGTGKEEEKYECRMCHGKGTTEDHVSSAPELNVSNHNGWEIQNMLGLDPDYSGLIRHEDIPKYIRKLLLLKNKGSEQYTQEPSVTTGQMRRTGDNDNITTIGRGPTMHDFGRSQQQVDRYIDKLLELFQFAQKNNASISWG